jgi:hypothetical protein
VGDPGGDGDAAAARAVSGILDRLCALVWSLGAYSQTATTVYGPFSLTSTSGTQLSNVLFPDQRIDLGHAARSIHGLGGTTAPDVRAHILVDGVERD